MLYCHESDCLLFLASPLVDGLDALTSRGLFISDIPIHDATRDIVLVGEQSRAQVGINRGLTLFDICSRSCRWRSGGGAAVNSRLDSARLSSE